MGENFNDEAGIAARQIESAAKTGRDPANSAYEAYLMEFHKFVYRHMKEDNWSSNEDIFARSLMQQIEADDPLLADGMALNWAAQGAWINDGTDFTNLNFDHSGMYKLRIMDYLKADPPGQAEHLLMAKRLENQWVQLDSKSVGGINYGFGRLGGHEFISQAAFEKRIAEINAQLLREQLRNP